MSEDAPLPPAQFFPSRSTVCTEPLATCLDTYHEVLDGFMFTVNLAAWSDQRTRIAKEALRAVDPEANDDVDDSSNTAQATMKTFRRILSQNLVNNSVNAFQRYLSQLIQECIRKNPAILTSNEQVTVKEIVGLTRMRDVVELLVERKINRLSYEGIFGFETYLSERRGLSLFETENERVLAREMIELRNINVHNGGVINPLFVNKLRGQSSRTFVVGEPHHVVWDQFVTYAANMWTIMLRLDREASRKFGLKRKRFSNWTPGYEHSDL